MLLQLRVQDFALIDAVELRLEPGLNVLTGETGTGKSILIDAIGLLLGQRASPDDVRAGARRAYVEGIFAGEAAAATGLLQQYDIEAEDTLVVSRDVAAEGRSVARMGGRALPARSLAELGRRLVDIHGQTEHQSLFRRPRQIDYLDRYGGLLEARRAVADLVQRLRATHREIRDLRQDERTLAREIDLLAFQAEEIEAAKLDPEEDTALRAERQVLAHAERLRELADHSGRLLDGDDPPGALDLLGEAQTALDETAALDPSAGAMRSRISEIQELLSDLSRELTSYAHSIEADPERLAELDARLDAIETLKRKYGETVEDVIAYGAEASERLARLAGRDDRLRALEEAESALAAELGRAAAALSQRRAEAGADLAAAIVRELADLNLPDAQFEARLHVRSDPDGLLLPGGTEPVAFDASGVDVGEFFMTVNPGQPLRPLAQVASGGETSRILLGLKSVLAAVDETPTLIFDEIDIGVGGRGGEMVGQKLVGLARNHQVLCVTHLATVAAFADAHFVVEKIAARGDAVTRVRRLTGREIVDEIAAMGGARTAPGRRVARDLLGAAQAWKHERARAETR